MKIGHKVPPHGGNGKLPGGIPTMRFHHKDGLNTDRTEKPVYSVNHLLICGMNLTKEFDAQVTVIISVTANAVHCHRRGCKEYISSYRKSLQKWLRKTI